MFDEEKANRAVSFVKLLRNTQGEYAKHPFNLMPFQEKIVKDLYSNRLKEKNNYNEEKFKEFRIDSVKIIEGTDKINLINDLYPEAKNTDIFAIVTYSIKPSNINNTAWIAGNGKIEGEWINSKSACVYITEENGVYTIKGDGTSW